MKTLQASKYRELVHSVCTSRGLLRQNARLSRQVDTILAPQAVDADGDSQYAKHCGRYKKPSITQELFKMIDIPHGHPCIQKYVFNILCKYPCLQKYVPMHVGSRSLTTQTMEDELESSEPQTQRSEMHTSDQTLLESPHMENRVMLRQPAGIMLKTDMVKDPDDDQDDVEGESKDNEKEFYNLIEAEDSPDELLSMLLNLEETFPSNDPRVCRTCLRLAKLCNETNGSPQKILDYARKAFHNFDSSRFPLEKTKSLFLVGIANYKMGELKEAVSVLERCVLMTQKLEDHQQELAQLQYNVHMVLGQAKVSIGWGGEGILDFQKGVTIIEKSLSLESMQLAACYHQTAEAYIQANKPMEALSLCRKALSIYLKACGPSSSEVAGLRSFMAQLYYDLDDHRTGLCQCELAAPVLEKLGKVDEAISLYLESMQAYFGLGKLHEAVVKLKEIIRKTEEDNPLHGEALILLVKALNGVNDNIAANEYCQKALKILESKCLTFESSKTLVRLSVAFWQLHNYDQALAIIKRTLQFLGDCTEKEAAAVAADAEGFTGFLLLSVGRPNEAVVHLERSITGKKSLYGSESAELLDVCNHLGVAYAQAMKIDEALALLTETKMLLEKSIGAAGLMSVYIHNNLSVTCSLSGRIDEAIEYKRQVVELLKKEKKESSVSLAQAEEDLEALVRVRNGEAACENRDKLLGKMLTSCSLQVHAVG